MSTKENVIRPIDEMDDQIVVCLACNYQHSNYLSKLHLGIVRLFIKKPFIMKTLGTLGILFILLSLLGCKYKNEALELQKQNQDLVTQLAVSDSLSNVYSLTLKEVETVFDSIMPIDNASEPTSYGKKLSTRLINKLDEINNLFLEKESNYNNLHSKLSYSNRMVSNLSVKIEELDNEVKGKDSINFILNQKVNKLQKQLADQLHKMDSVVQEKQKSLAALNNQTNTIFFIAGSESELRNKNIIEKTGGFLGFLGRVNTLNPKLDKSQLERIDLREKTSFTLNAETKRIEFITNHDPASYELNDSSGGSTMLTIKDSEQFWKYSKYLVITY